MSQVTTGSWILDHNLHEGRSGGPAFVQHCYTVTPTVLPQHFSVASDMTMHQVEKGAWWSLTLKVCRSTLDQMGVITNITIYNDNTMALMISFVVIFVIFVVIIKWYQMIQYGGSDGTMAWPIASNPWHHGTRLANFVSTATGATCGWTEDRNCVRLMMSQISLWMKMMKMRSQYLRSANIVWLSSIVLLASREGTFDQTFGRYLIDFNSLTLGLPWAWETHPKRNGPLRQMGHPTIDVGNNLGYKQQITTDNNRLSTYSTCINCILGAITMCTPRLISWDILRWFRRDLRQLNLASQRSRRIRRPPLPNTRGFNHRYRRIGIT
jgi:hypothetical protein